MVAIALSPSVRADLLALRNTSELMNPVPQRLATGKRANSALDNPVNYFTWQYMAIAQPQVRQDFTNQMIATLQSSADGLVLTHRNQEGANLLALPTRQQLSTTAVSLAAQSGQNVFRLFR